MPARQRILGVVLAVTLMGGFAWFLISVVGPRTPQLDVTGDTDVVLHEELHRSSELDEELSDSVFPELAENSHVTRGDDLYVVVGGNLCPRIELSLTAEERRLAIDVEVENGDCDDMHLLWVAHLRLDRAELDEVVVNHE